MTMTGSSDNEANDVTVKVFASSRKRSARGLACVKGGRCIFIVKLSMLCSNSRTPL